jgi:Cation transport ATPase
VAELPFDSIRGWMVTCHKQPNGRFLWIVKGAPERVLPQLLLTGKRIHFWLEQVEALASQGLRTLLLASKESDTSCMDAGCRLDEYGIIGIMAMQDPPRTAAIDAIAQCKQAGIKLVMLTGDHIATASAIARQMSLSDKPHALTGTELDALDDDELIQKLPHIDIIARATPANKLRLIHAFQKQGHIMAMTGDGINDAPALKQADIGVAMGKTGTDTAKEASAIVLADDNFATLAEAIREGRVIYENLRKTLIFLLPTNCAQALVLMIALLLDATLPITPIQILWINMVSAITLALPLAFEQGSPALMQRPPRGANHPLLNFSSWLLIAIASLSMALIATTGFEWQRTLFASIEESRTFAINLLIGGEIAFLVNCRHLQGALSGLDALRGNRTLPLAISAILLLQLLQCYLPWMNHLFGTAPLPIRAWGGLAAVSLGYWWLMESMKKITGQTRSG